MAQKGHVVPLPKGAHLRANTYAQNKRRFPFSPEHHAVAPVLAAHPWKSQTKIGPKPNGDTKEKVIAERVSMRVSGVNPNIQLAVPLKYLEKKTCTGNPSSVNIAALGIAMSHSLQ
jgi:hypothetical protein